jgi:hypothetical protein
LGFWSISLSSEERRAAGAWMLRMGVEDPVTFLGSLLGPRPGRAKSRAGRRICPDRSRHRAYHHAIDLRSRVADEVLDLGGDTVGLVERQIVGYPDRDVGRDVTHA